MVSTCNTEHYLSYMWAPDWTVLEKHLPHDYPFREYVLSKKDKVIPGKRTGIVVEHVRGMNRSPEVFAARKEGVFVSALTTLLIAISAPVFLYYIVTLAK